MWSDDVCAKPRKLVDRSGDLSQRLEYQGGKLAGRLTAKTVKRMLAEETPMMLEGMARQPKVYANMAPPITTRRR